ncbi:MAG: hypothetical protein KDB03_14875 [Planctomycetales bacterium]|nr:hypothetical protein [Planctomycetales bacterium]
MKTEYEDHIPGRGWVTCKDASSIGTCIVRTIFMFSLITRIIPSMTFARRKPHVRDAAAALQVLHGLALAMLISNIGLAQTCDEMCIWEVSSRCLPDGGYLNCNQPFVVSRYDGCRWQPSSFEDMLNAPCFSTADHRIVYVHGNWMEHSGARERALLFYRKLCCQSTGPICLVCYSWPSERESRPLKDVFTKKSRVATEYFYLADLLQRIPNDKTLGIHGFSFGGAIVAGALHLISGGSINCHEACKGPFEHECMRVSLVASAFDRNAFSNCGEFSQALGHVACLTNLYNSADPVLKRFRFFDLGAAPIAAGFAGILMPAGGAELDHAPKIVQVDCSRYTGRSHFEVEYYQQCPFTKVAIENLLYK